MQQRSTTVDPMAEPNQHRGEQRPAPRRDNLHIGAVSLHSLDRLNMSNDFPPKKIPAKGRQGLTTA